MTESSGNIAHRCYQAQLASPCGTIGIRCEHEVLTGIDFLIQRRRSILPRDAFTREVSAQLAAYFKDAGFRFSLPIQPTGTEHQQKVWQILQHIPRGQTLSYGEIAREISSSARAVGQACGSNPLPLVVPCHRVVSKSGLGGFMHRTDNKTIDIKRWLLAHEQR